MIGEVRHEGYNTVVTRLGVMREELDEEVDDLVVKPRVRCQSEDVLPLQGEVGSR